VEYFEDRRIEINHKPVSLVDLEEQLREIFRDRRNKTLYIAGHGSLRYGEIVAVIDASKGAGVNRVGIITDGMRRALSY
jgi:biopolymer transport protein ExbD